MGWVIKRYWQRLSTHRAFATSPTRPDAVHLHTHSEVAIARHVKGFDPCLELIEVML
jgi:hypothetical protein